MHASCLLKLSRAAYGYINVVPSLAFRVLAAAASSPPIHPSPLISTTAEERTAAAYKYSINHNADEIKKIAKENSRK